MLMKALQTGSLFLAEKWNNSSFVCLSGQPASDITGNRPALAGTIFGALTIILLYLLTAELFGAEVALLAAALWAFDPQAIGFQSHRQRRHISAFLFPAGKHLLAARPTRGGEQHRAAGHSLTTGPRQRLRRDVGVEVSSLNSSLSVSATTGCSRPSRKLVGVRQKEHADLSADHGGVFLLLNPTILLPATWREMGIFAGQKRIGHDGYEFMGSLYSHRMTDWLKGTPWYFYFVFMAVKLPVLTVAAFVVGLPLLFRRKLGDGRYFILFWMFVWVMTFMWSEGSLRVTSQSCCRLC